MRINWWLDVFRIVEERRRQCFLLGSFPSEFASSTRQTVEVLRTRQNTTVCDTFEACLKKRCRPGCKRWRESAAGGGEKVRHRNQIKSRRVAGVNSPTFVCVWIAVV